MTIGWIGTGIMGAPMAGHLQAAGHDLRIFSRTRAKAAALEEGGAFWCDTPREAATGADVVFSIVGYPEDVEHVWLGDDGIRAGASEGAILVDMTTSSPALARRLASEAERIGCAALDAPVSGGDVGAREARLSIMVGGDAAAFERAAPLFAAMGRTVARMGGPGAGQHTKMANQILIASTMIGVIESLEYADRAELDRAQVIEVIGSGAAGSWSINNLGPRIVRGDMNPGFMVRHFLKDLRIALESARELNVALPGLALAEQLYRAASAQGLDDRGTHALALVMARLNGR